MGNLCRVPEERIEMEEEVWNMKAVLEGIFGKEKAEKIGKVASLLEARCTECEIEVEEKIGLVAPSPSFADFIEEAIEIMETNPACFEKLLEVNENGTEREAEEIHKGVHAEAQEGP